MAAFIARGDFILNEGAWLRLTNGPVRPERRSVHVFVRVDLAFLPIQHFGVR